RHAGRTARVRRAAGHPAARVPGQDQRRALRRHRAAARAGDRTGRDADLAPRRPRTDAPRHRQCARTGAPRSPLSRCALDARSGEPEDGVLVLIDLVDVDPIAAAVAVADTEITLAMA